MRNSTTTRDVYSIVTDHIIEQLEHHVIPWKQPWIDSGVPRKFVSQRPYRGINFLLLNSYQYETNEYLTFKQVQDLGATVRKGEKGHLVTFWIWHDQREEEPQSHRRATLRYYFVFNVSQCLSIPERASPLPKINHDPIEFCEEMVERMPYKPEIVHNKGSGAYYYHDLDYISLPLQNSFWKCQEYYATLFHELIHSTGHEKRLGRKELVQRAKFGSEAYSIEELIAEIGACYLMSYAGIVDDQLKNNVAYIQGWLECLRRDKRFIVYASAHAQKAVDFILCVKSGANDVLDDNLLQNMTRHETSKIT